MDAAQVAVTAGGAALVAGILWFFLGPRRPAPAPRPPGGLPPPAAGA